MPKPKNDGVMLSVRIPHASHAQLARIKAALLKDGKRPGEVTSGRIVEEALKTLEVELLHCGAASAT